MAYNVFISYSRVDLPFVELLDEFLTKLGIITWFDRKSLRPGQKWEDIIDDEIRKSQIFLTCLSKAGLDKRGYFHVEQNLASEAALRVPGDELFILPVLLGDCDIPRKLRQYHTVNLVEPGAIEMLLLSLSSALNREVLADPESVATLREHLLAYLGAEGTSNQEFVERFMQTDELSFQDSMGLIQRIANSSDTNRLGILLNLRALEFLSYAEQSALDTAIDNVKLGRRTEDLQNYVKNAEMSRITQMAIPGNPQATQLLQINKYFRYISRKNTEAYRKAEHYIHRLLAGEG